MAAGRTPNGPAAGQGFWPAGVKCPVAVTFDLDTETLWLSRNPASASSPGLLSQGAYGPKVGVPRILSALDGLGIKSTFFVPGRVVERYPGVVRSIVSWPPGTRSATTATFTRSRSRRNMRSD